MLVKTNKKDFFRDTDTGAVINTNLKEFERYKKRRDEYNEMKLSSSEVSSLKEQVAFLQKLVESMAK